MKKVILTAIFTLTAITSNAYVIGGSNMGVMGYPEFPSYKTPYSPATASRYDMEQYQRDVKEYLENANHDIERILEAKQKAVADYQNAVRQYNNKSYY